MGLPPCSWSFARLSIAVQTNQVRPDPAARLALRQGAAKDRRWVGRREQGSPVVAPAAAAELAA